MNKPSKLKHRLPPVGPNTVSFSLYIWYQQIHRPPSYAGRHKMNASTLLMHSLFDSGITHRLTGQWKPESAFTYVYACQVSGSSPDLWPIQIWWPILGDRYYVTFALCHRNSVCRLSVLRNVGAPYSQGWTFRQYFCTTLYHSHLATLTPKLRPSSDACTLTGLSNAGGVSCFILETIQDSAVVNMERE